MLPEFASIAQESPNCVVLGDAGEEFSYENVNRAFQVLLSLPKPILLSMGNGYPMQSFVSPLTNSLKEILQRNRRSEDRRRRIRALSRVRVRRESRDRGQALQILLRSSARRHGHENGRRIHALFLKAKALRSFALDRDDRRRYRGRHCGRTGC